MAARPSKRTTPPKTPARPRVPVRLDDYLRAVEHDLRGSLNSIIGWADLVKRQALPAEGHVRAGETIIRQARQQLDLINEVIDTWRLLSGNLLLNLAPIDARELVSQAAHAAKESSRKAVTFDLQLKALPAPLVADAARIRQVLIGLFSSAIHVAPENGTIEVALTPGDKGSAELTVRGAGMGAGHAKEPPRAKFGRSLALIRGIIELHGGTMKAKIEASGATFRVTLPRAVTPRPVRRSPRPR